MGQERNPGILLLLFKWIQNRDSFLLMSKFFVGFQLIFQKGKKPNEQFRMLLFTCVPGITNRCIDSGVLINGPHRFRSNFQARSLEKKNIKSRVRLQLSVWWWENNIFFISFYYRICPPPNTHSHKCYYLVNIRELYSTLRAGWGKWAQ